MSALLAAGGCPRVAFPPPGPADRGSISAGSRQDAVLHIAVRTEEAGETVSYVGDGWRLSVERESGWRVAQDQASTLKLVRDAEGVAVALCLRVYAIRPGMAPKTFLAAHAMWLAEERAPRVEYTWDKDLNAWQGYSVGGDRETYYLFRVSGDRAYVIEESAESAALGARAADEFQRIAASFQCGPENS